MQEELQKKPQITEQFGVATISLVMLWLLVSTTIKVNAQCVTQPLINFAFAGGSTTPVITTGAGLSCSATATQTISASSGTGFAVSTPTSFFTNAANDAIQINAPALATNSITFTITGNNISQYKTFEMFVSATRTSTTSGNPAMTLQYSKDGGAFTAFGGSTALTTSYINVTNAIGTGGNNPSTSLSIRLIITTGLFTGTNFRIDNFQVRALPDPNIAPVTTGDAICLGANASITADVPGKTFSYKWYSTPSGTTSLFSGTPFTPSNGDGTPPLNNNNGGTSSSFYAESNLFGCALASRSVAVVNVGATLSITADASLTTICNGVSTLLNSNPSGGGAPYSYAWSPATGLSSTSVQNPTATPSTPTIYTVTVTDNCSPVASASATVQITVNPLPGLSINTVPSPAVICTSGSVALTANGTNTYSWSPNSSLSATTGASVIASPPSATTYIVTGTSAAGCTSTQSITVNVSPAVNILSTTATPNNPCFNASSQLNALAANTNSYSTTSISFGFLSTAGFTSVSLANNAMSAGISLPFDVSFYGRNFTQMFICSNGFLQMGTSSGSTGVFGQALPNASNPNNIIAGVWADLDPGAGGTISYGTSGVAPNRVFTVQFSAVPFKDQLFSSNGNATFQVQIKENGNIIEVHVQTVTTSLVPSTSVTTLGLKNFDGSAFTAPSGRFNNGNWNVSTPEAWRFTPSGGTYNYSWSPPTFLSATNISNPVAQNITGTTTYIVTASDANGCSATNNVTITINPITLNCSSSPSGTPCFGTTVNLQSLPAGGSTPYSYLWSTGATTQNTSITASTSQTYTVTVTDNCGNTQSCSVPVNVTPPPPVTVSSVPSPAVICTSGSVALTANGTNTYSWSPNSSLSATTGASVIASPPSATTYIVTGTSAAGCTSTQSITVNVSPVVNILSTTATPNNPCFNASSQLNALAANTNSYSTTSIPFGFLSTAGFTSVSLANNAMSAGISLPFDVSFYGRNFTQMFICSNGFLQMGTSSGSTGVFGQTLPNASNPNNIIAGVWADLDPGAGGTISYGTSGVAPNRVFTVQFSAVPFKDQLFSSNGNATFQVQIKENGNIIEVHVQTVTTSLIPPTSVTTMGLKNFDGSAFTAPSGRFNNGNWNVSTPEAWRFTPSGGTYSYSWSPPIFLSATNISNPVAQNITGTTTYSVTASDANGCSATNSVTIIIDPISLNCSSSPSGAPCFGSTVNLQSAPTGGSTPYSFLWSTGSTNQNTSITASTSQTYTVTVTDVCGNSQSCSVPVSVTSPPPVTVSSVPSPAVICTSGSVALTANGAVSYTWMPASGLSATTGVSVAASPLVTTTYTVTGTGSNGCSATQSKTVTVSPAIAMTATASPANVCFGSNSNLTATAFNTSSYSLTTIPFSYKSTSGFSSVTLSDDAISGAISLPFNFSFYGQNFNQLFICSNGYIQFGTSSNSTGVYGQTLPSAANPNNIIAAVWADLNPGAGGTISYGTTGTAPDRVFTVQFNAVPFYDQLFSGSGNASFQIQLYEKLNRAEVHLQTVTTAIFPSTSVTTLALKNNNGSAFTAPAGRFNSGNWNVSTSQAYRFSPSGGTYNFTWTPSAFLSATNISNPVVQNITTSTTYTVTALDANGCSSSVSIPVNVYPSVSCNALTVSVPICQNSSFTVTANPSSGLTPYSFLWSTGATTSVITDNKPAGVYTYTVTVTDNCGTSCTSSVTANINLFKPYLAEPDTAVCSNNPGFYIHVKDSGAYSSGFPLGTTFEFVGYTVPDLADSLLVNSTGSYTVIVRLPGYLGGCQEQTATSTILFNVDAAQMVLSSDSVSCFSDSSGRAVASIVFGGNSSYRWEWFNSTNNKVRDITNNNTSDTLSGVPAGMYTLVLTDHQGNPYAPFCEVVDSIFIGQPAGGISVTENISGHSNEYCFGNATGTIDIGVTGGTGTYSYLWSDGNILQDRNNLTAGAYTITVSDARGCTKSLTIVITQPPLLIPSCTTSSVSCYGGSNGIASVAVSGGTPGYSYIWNTSETTSSLTGLVAGTYSVTVTDVNGCSATCVSTVSQPAILSVNEVHSDVLCHGMPTGGIDLAITGGTTPYSFLWNDGATSEDRTNISAGTYTATVTDAHQCTTTISVAIIEPATTVGLTTGSTPVNCYGGSNGTAEVFASGGTGGYTYLWSTSAVTSSLNNLSSGSYTVTVTDANLCSASVSISVIQPAEFITICSSTGVSCNGGNNGSVSVMVSGGTAGYAYAWSTSSSGSSVTALYAGTYTVTVTDAHGCTVSCQSAVTEPQVLQVAESHGNVNCNSGTDGSINITVTGGTAGYNYLWNNGSTNKDRSGLQVGTYTVTVTDFNGCMTSKTIVITQPSSLSVSSSSTNPTSTVPSGGTINIVATGGTPGYSYLWNTGSTSQNLTGLPAGTYTVTVTDSNGCTAIHSRTLSTICMLSFTNQLVQNASCYKNNGIMTVIPSGGTSYSYTWQTTPVQTTATGTGLAYGMNSYVLITDVSGCSRMDTVIVPTSLGLGLVLTSPTYSGGKNIRCYGENNGSISLTVSGSTGPYSYKWSNGATTQNIAGLAAGTYMVTVSNGGCTNISLITLYQPSALIANSSSTNAACFGGNNGSATAVPGGGTSPYSYTWNTVPVQTSATATGLSAGIYVVTISDANGCTKTAVAAVTQPASISVTGITTQARCNGTATGSIDITPSGGMPPYSYLWSTGATTQDRMNVLAAGTYTVTVTDSRGCSVQYSNTVTEPPAISASSVKTNVSCYGGNNGTAGVTASGGTPPYTYSWNTSPVKNTASVTGLIAGNFNCTISDSKGCLKVVPVSITQPPVITISISKTNCSSYGSNNGSATANVGGGTPSYQYSWNTFPVKTTQTASGLFAGTYTVTVTDAAGCTKTGTVTITQPSPRLAGDELNDNSFSSIYPNPSPGFINITFSGEVQSKVGIAIYSLTGEKVYNSELEINGSSSFSLDLSHLAKGVYTVKYQANRKSWIEKLVLQ